jgi:hypothetical protein
MAWDMGVFPRTDWPCVQWLPEFERFGARFSLAVPLWLPWLAVAGFTVWRRRADRLIVPQACNTCGYDRRGLAADAKCPECGTTPAAGSPRCGCE